MSAFAIAGSVMIGWMMTSAIDCARTKAASRSMAASGASPASTALKPEIVVMPPASAAMEPDV